MHSTLACNADWLDSTAPTLAGNLTYGEATTTTNAIGNCSNQWYYGGYWYPYYPLTTTATYTITDPRPIKLKMSEVERLRRAAKEDSKLKAILNKFTTQIEIAVDFD